MAVSTTSKIVGTLQDGRSIEKVTHIHVVTAGSCWVEFTTPILKNIDAVLHIEVDETSPETHAYGFSHKKITGNTVGVSIHEIGTGTSITLVSTLLGY